MEETVDLSNWDSGTTSNHDIVVTVPEDQDIRLSFQNGIIHFLIHS